MGKTTEKIDEKIIKEVERELPGDPALQQIHIVRKLISHPLAQKSMTSCHAFLLIVKLGDRTSPSVLTRTIPSDPLKAHSRSIILPFSANLHPIGHFPRMFSGRSPAWNSDDSSFLLHGVSSLGCLSSPIPTPRSRQHPGHRVLDADGDLSSGSSEGHTDVAIRDGSRRTHGLVDSSGCLHAGNRRHVLAYREVEAILIYDRRIGMVSF
ncbi:hypothetical protein ES708_30209 [subsurface metagenome]